VDRLRYDRRPAGGQRQGIDRRARAKCTLKDPGASGWITVQGSGRIGKMKLQTPAMIRFGEETDDEVFITYEAATAGVEVENTGTEPLVGLRYFGPDVHKNLPKIGDHKKRQATTKKKK